MLRRARRDASVAVAAASSFVAMLGLEACGSSITESSIADGGADVSSDGVTAYDAAPADAPSETGPTVADAAGPEGADAQAGDAAADAGDDATSSEVCVPVGPYKCGPNPLCCGASNGAPYDSARNCIDYQASTALWCNGLATPQGCIAPGLIVGCVTGGGGTYFTPNGGVGPGFASCPPDLHEKVINAPPCP